MFRTIVCATDGSSHAARAMAIAVDLAARYDAKLVVVHAVAEDGGARQPPQMRVRKVLDEAAGDAGRQLGRDVVTHLETGDPADVILRAIGREGADLVVMGSRGLGEIKGLLQGSVSHKIAQLAPCPCLTVK